MSQHDRQRDDALLDSLYAFARHNWPVTLVARMAGMSVDDEQLASLAERGLIERGRRETIVARSAEITDSFGDREEDPAEIERAFEYVTLSQKGWDYVRDQRSRERFVPLALARDITAAARGRLDAAAVLLATIALIVAIIALAIAVLAVAR